MHSKVTRALSSVLILGIYGCAFGKLGERDRNQLVEDDVPGIFQSALTGQESASVAGRVALQVEGLRAKGWHVEASDEANYDLYKKKHPEKKLIVDAPEDKSRGEEAASDLYISAMLEQWTDWTVAIQKSFFSSRPEYDQSVRNRYFRLVAPDLNRFYDVVIVKLVKPDATLAADPVLRDPRVDALWKIMDPPDPEARTSVFGPVRYVKPVATSKLQVGRYAILQSYLERFFHRGSIFHGRWGETRVRDTYILALVSRTEVVVVQTKLRNDLSRDTVADDLSEILAGKPVSTLPKQPR